MPKNEGIHDPQLSNVLRTPTHYCPKLQKQRLSIISDPSHHPLLLWSPLASKELHMLQKEPKRAILDGEKFQLCLFLPPYLHSAISKKFKLKICDVATRKLSLT